jgi:transcriptional regulator of aromatic amino acid metabolism
MVVTMHSADFAWLTDETLISWLTMRDRRPNLMVVARGLPVDAVADRLMSVCSPPILPSILPGRLHLPASRRGTVLLQNVTALSIPQQITLNDWIDEGLGQAQVLSITTTPLWQLVQNGDFLEGLFYRLNVVCLDAAPRLTQMH